MSTPLWIKLQLQPDDSEIHRLAELTDQPLDAVYVAVMRWFFYVDSHFADEVTGMSSQAIDKVIRWGALKSLASAMQDNHIRWLEPFDDGTMRILGYEKHFGKSSKRRALGAQRQAEFRARNASVTHERYERNGEALRERHLDKNRVDKNKNKNKNNNPPTPQGGRCLAKTKITDWDRAIKHLNGSPLNCDRFRGAWESWCEYRRATKHRMTDLTIQRQIAKLGKFGIDGAIASIEASITQGWQGLFEPRDTFGGGGGDQAKPAAPIHPVVRDATERWPEHVAANKSAWVNVAKAVEAHAMRYDVVARSNAETPEAFLVEFQATIKGPNNG